MLNTIKKAAIHELIALQFNSYRITLTFCELHTPHESSKVTQKTIMSTLSLTKTFRKIDGYKNCLKNSW